MEDPNKFHVIFYFFSIHKTCEQMELAMEIIFYQGKLIVNKMQWEPRRNLGHHIMKSSGLFFLGHERLCMYEKS
jgi:hypothetical protein